MADIIQMRRDTAANWTAANPILAEGEIGYEIDTYQLKIGTGIADWLTLPYVVSSGGGGVTDHGALTGLGDDDHTQYHTNARGDARYTLIAHTNSTSGHPLATTSANGFMSSTDKSKLNGLTSDHGGLGGLADDDHTQYYNQARGDARYSQLSHVHAEFTQTVDGFVPAPLTVSGRFLSDSGTWEIVSAGGVTDHGALSGLGDDDHTQYLTNGRGDVRYAPIAHVGATGTAHGNFSVGVNGFVPGPGSANGYVLADDGTWVPRAVSAVGGIFITMRFDSAIGGIPAVGHITYNAATAQATTSVNISETTESGNDASTILGIVRVGDIISIQSTGGTPQQSHAFRVASIAVDQGTYRSMGVQWISTANGELSDNESAQMVFIPSPESRLPQGGVLGDVLYKDSASDYDVSWQPLIFAGAGGKGFVPDPVTEQGFFLRDDGTWTQVSSGGGVTDHGALTGLADDDHTQYYNQARGDARYSLTTHSHSNFTSSVPGFVPAPGTVSGKVLTDNGTWATFSAGVTDHGNLTGLADDDHSQYHNDARGDARYAQLTGAAFTGAVTFATTLGGVSDAAKATVQNVIIDCGTF